MDKWERIISRKKSRRKLSQVIDEAFALRSQTWAGLLVISVLMTDSL